MAWRRGRSYSQDLRDRVLAANDLSARQAADRFAVSVSYVIKARQRRDRTGALTIKPRGYRKPERVAGREDLIRREVERRPSATLAELRAWLLSDHGVSLSTSTMWKSLRKIGLTLKKSRSAPPSRRVRTLRQPVKNGESCSPS